MRTMALLLAATFFARLGYAQATRRTPDVAVAPQYDTTHVYLLSLETPAREPHPGRLSHQRH
jgi:hypothetical protein